MKDAKIIEEEFINTSLFEGIGVLSEFEKKSLLKMFEDSEYEELKYINNKKNNFNGNDFIRLFLALLLKEKNNKIDISTLGYDLIEFYNNEYYKELFNIPILELPESDYVDVDNFIIQSVSNGILSSHSILNKNDRLILLTKEEAQKIIGSYDYIYVSKMNEIVDKYIAKIRFKNLKIACSKYPEIQLNPNGKPFINEATPKYVVDNFVENGFVEEFCLTDDELKEVKKLRLEKKFKE